MADIKIAYGAEQTMTVTNLQSLASSATAGWQSTVVDNATTDKFDDVMAYFVFDFANTAAANSKGVYVYAYSGIGTSYTNPCTGAEGTITLPDVTANMLSLVKVGFVPYVTTDEVVESAHFSIARAFGGRMPQKWGIVLMNHSGAALAASGNTAKYYGVYYTAA
jgi:hypothetical protein